MAMLRAAGAAITAAFMAEFNCSCKQPAWRSSTNIAAYLAHPLLLCCIFCFPCLAGDVYILLTGNRAYGMPRNMLNQPRTGIYMMPRGGSAWQLLRGTVAGNPATAAVKPWQYPTSFAVDWSSGSPGNRSRLLLADFINNGQTPGSAGVWKTRCGAGVQHLCARAAHAHADRCWSLPAALQGYAAALQSRSLQRV